MILDALIVDPFREPYRLEGREYLGRLFSCVSEAIALHHVRPKKSTSYRLRSELGIT